MPDLWRISNHLDLTGEGGLRYAARWHSAGHPIVYLAESAAGALIEVLVHLELDGDELPPGFTLLRIAVPPQVLMLPLDPPGAASWRLDASSTRQIGDGWLRGRQSALARVPSVLLPSTWNVLLNPLHEDAQHLVLAEAVRALFDPRLLRRTGRG